MEFRKESFFSKIEWINELKLRGSFGEVGKFTHQLWWFELLHRCSYSLGLNNANETGILTNDQGAPNLKWEKNSQKISL
jgi:hypothetical protein